MTTATVTLPIIGDTRVEGDETTVLELSRGDNGIITNVGGAKFFVELTIVDDDGVPAAPAAPVLVPKGAGLDVSWLPPTDTGGMAITDYDVRHGIKPTSGDPATWTELTDTSDSTALSATISGLTNGTAYVVQVRAQNENGNGAWSASATATPSTMTLSYTTPPTTLTVNTPITGFDGDHIRCQRHYRVHGESGPAAGVIAERDQRHHLGDTDHGEHESDQGDGDRDGGQQHGDGGSHLPGGGQGPAGGTGEPGAEVRHHPDRLRIRGDLGCGEQRGGLYGHRNVGLWQHIGDGDIPDQGGGVHRTAAWRGLQCDGDGHGQRQLRGQPGINGAVLDHTGQQRAEHHGHCRPDGGPSAPTCWWMWMPRMRMRAIRCNTGRLRVMRRWRR